MKIINHEGKNFLETEYTTGNKAWCAKITGTNLKYGFEREFINSTRKGLKLYPLPDEEIYFEEVVFSHSGKNRSDYYWKWTGTEMVQTDKKTLLLFSQISGHE